MISEAVLKEWMFAYPLGKKQTWFAREKDKPISFSAKLQGDNPTIEGLTRPNSLFLSAAAQNNHQALLPLYRWFSQSISVVVGERSRVGVLTTALCQNADFRDRLTGLLSVADLGIAGLRVRDTQPSEQLSSELLARVLASMK